MNNFKSNRSEHIKSLELEIISAILISPVSNIPNLITTIKSMLTHDYWYFPMTPLMLNAIHNTSSTSMTILRAEIIKNNPSITTNDFLAYYDSVLLSPPDPDIESIKYKLNAIKDARDGEIALETMESASVEIIKNKNPKVIKSTIEKLNHIVSSGSVDEDINLLDMIIPDELTGDIKSLAHTDYALLNPIPGLNTVISGFQQSTLLVISGPTSVGKSLLAQTLAMEWLVNENNCDGLYISLEMTASQLSIRALAYHTDITALRAYRIQSGIDYLTDDEISSTYLKFKNIKNKLYYSELTKSSDIFAHIEKYAVSKNIKYVIIDHLQLVRLQRSYAGNKVEAYEEFMSELISLKNRLGIVIILLVQQARSKELDGNDKLKGSGSIAEGANIIFLIDPVTERDASGTLINKKERYNGIDMELLRITISKNRGGKVGNRFTALRNGNKMRLERILPIQD